MATRRKKLIAPPRKDVYERKPEFDYHGFEEKKTERMIRPGKDRFFHANFKHDVKDPDAYATVYQILIEESDYLKVQRFLNRDDIDLELEPHIIQFLEECFIVRENWDRFAQDMKIVSSKIKDVLFKIECFGEDFGNDIWFAFALNGKYYQDDVEIKYPEFDPTRMFLKDE